MTNSVSMRKGWCPGALQPMRTGDGLLVRLRISGGILSVGVANEIALLSRLYGNGLIDLSSRANLQLRGVSERTLPHLLARLAELDLLDHDSKAEAVRNVIASPLAGLADTRGRIDIRPLTKALEHALAEAEDLYRLPGKFGFLIDDGSGLSLRDVAADIRFDLTDEPDRRRFAIGIGGAASDAAWLGTCEPGEMVAIALHLARAFLHLGTACDEPPRRMRELIDQCGAEAVGERAGLPAERISARITHSLRARVPLEAASVGEGIGAFRIRPGLPDMLAYEREGPCLDCDYLGIGVPFGRLSGDMFGLAAWVAAEFGTGELRLTPWRALLLPGIRESDAAAIVDLFAKAGFIVGSADPRLAIAACPGAPGCEKGTTPTHEDALALAPLAKSFRDLHLKKTGIAVHISGCAKGCARPVASPFTLVGNAGKYDLVMDGTAQDSPHFTGLSLADIGARLAAEIEEQEGRPHEH